MCTASVQIARSWKEGHLLFLFEGLLTVEELFTVEDLCTVVDLYIVEDLNTVVSL